MDFYCLFELKNKLSDDYAVFRREFDYAEVEFKKLVKKCKQFMKSDQFDHKHEGCVKLLQELPHYGENHSNIKYRRIGSHLEITCSQCRDPWNTRGFLTMCHIVDNKLLEDNLVISEVSNSLQNVDNEQVKNEIEKCIAKKCLEMIFSKRPRLGVKMIPPSCSWIEEKYEELKSEED